MLRSGARDTGRLLVKGARFCLVVSKFHKDLGEGLVGGARGALRKAGVSDKHIHEVWVPGSFEIPFAVSALMEKKGADAFIALGVVVRGQTRQYEIIAHQTAHAIQMLACTSGVPVTLGLVVAETLAQARARALPGSANRGAEAAHSAIELLNLFGPKRKQRS